MRLSQEVAKSDKGSNRHSMPTFDCARFDGFFGKVELMSKHRIWVMSYGKLGHCPHLELARRGNTKQLDHSGKMGVARTKALLFR
jgi:hypothetical protein